jgi:hypothetical protein
MPPPAQAAGGKSTAHSTKVKGPTDGHKTAAPTTQSGVRAKNGKMPPI